MALVGTRVSLALQGGGSHGAFTWGVLERLLEEGGLTFDAISGASAGAMNAVLLAYGMTTGGREGAIAALRAFWEGIASSQPLGELAYGAMLAGSGPLGEAALPLKTLVFLSHFFSPYQLNPFDINPLRDLLTRLVDFERLRLECPIELYIATTRVASGNLRVFGTREMSLAVLLASACLPTVHHTVEIEGDAYWDGGLSANPPLLPLLSAGRADDLLMVLLHAEPGDKVPSRADEISARLTGMGFAAGFQAELRALHQARSRALEGWLAFDAPTRRLRRLRVHAINDAAFMGRLASLSQVNTDGGFIATLHRAGRACAEEWLARCGKQLGRRSTASLETLLQ